MRVFEIMNTIIFPFVNHAKIISDIELDNNIHDNGIINYHTQLPLIESKMLTSVTVIRKFLKIDRRSFTDRSIFFETKYKSFSSFTF